MDIGLNDRILFWGPNFNSHAVGRDSWVPTSSKLSLTPTLMVNMSPLCELRNRKKPSNKLFQIIKVASLKSMIPTCCGLTNSASLERYFLSEFHIKVRFWRESGSEFSSVQIIYAASLCDHIIIQKIKKWPFLDSNYDINVRQKWS